MAAGATHRLPTSAWHFIGEAAGQKQAWLLKRSLQADVKRLLPLLSSLLKLKS